MKSTRLFFVSLLIVCFTLPLFAADFSPTIEAQLAKAAPDEFVSAIVILESPIDIRLLDDRLHDEKAPLARRHEEVIAALKYNASQTQPAFEAELEQARAKGQISGFTAYWIENLFVVYAQRTFLESLRDRMDVKYVSENFQAELMEPLRPTGKIPERRTNSLDTESTTPGQDAIRATEVNRVLGITGQGVLVANLDTGVDGTHPALASRWRGNTEPLSECWLDVLGGWTNPGDGNGHGTHVMGTITGREISGTDTNTVGSAPDARWIACNAINQGVGSEFDNDVIAAYEWFIDPDNNPGTLDDVPDVIQNSWGVNTSLGYSQCFDFWNTVILNCEAAGPVITWSAGNEGPSASTHRAPASYSINDYQIFSVGAVNATEFSAPYPIASFSSRGPTLCTPASPDDIKPEISAPGVNVYSSVPGGGYNGTYSGTSMAGPHVAGVVALMRQACPDCDYQTIKEAIMSTAVDYGTAGNDNTYGYGFIDAYEAVLAVSDLGRLAGSVDDGSNPLENVQVKITSGTNTTVTDAAGDYVLPLSAGTYSVEYSKFGYVTQTIPGLSIVEGDTTWQNVSLSLAPTGTLSGVVTHCDGGPAVGAVVEIVGAPVASEITNSSGFYSFTIPQGTYDVSASGAGCGEHLVTDVVVGASTTQNLTLPSDPRFECSAPDGGGYVACEDGDGGGPVFSWFEIFPDAGGPGAYTGITGDDDGATLSIPFNFRFYGTDYTSVWVCSNGFLSFSGTATTYTNEPMPGSVGTGIAAFWDDLNPESVEHIASYYHAAENAFIIEWYQIGHWNDTGSLETFQIWLYDVATNPGPTGDSQIRIQYQDMTSLGSATVGTSNGTFTNQYVFDGSLDVNAQGLTDSRVILFNGGASEYGTVQGVVTDLNSSLPLENVMVTRIGSGQSVMTNASGFYSLNVAPGTHNFEYTRADHVTEQVNGVIVNDQDVITEDVALTALPVIEGTVTDASTLLPLSGVLVSRAGSAQTTVTNAAGYYSMYFDPGTYQFDFEKIGYLTASTGNITFFAGDIVTEDIGLVARPVVTLLDEDFESGAAGWTHSAPGGWNDQWHLSTERANSGATSWKCGDTGIGTYASSLDAQLTSPVISNIPVDATVSYWTQIEGEASGTWPDSAYDGGVFEVSTNGAVWNQLAPQSGYTHTFRNSSSGPLPGADCFAGDIISWTEHTVDLSAYEGQDLQLRFRFGSDGGVENEGWYVDDVLLQGYGEGFTAPDALTISLDTNTGNLVFRWNDTGAPLYTVFSSASSDGPFDTVVGSSAGTSLSVAVPVASSQFYVVVAGGGGSAITAPTGLTPVLFER